MKLLTKLTDQELVNAYANDNNEAFDELLRRHSDKVYAYIFHFIKNREIVDDIFQETFVKAIMTIKQGRYTEHGKFSAWLIRIAHNLVIDNVRRDKLENLISADDDETDFLNRRELAEGNVEDHMVNDQTRSDIRNMVMSLPDAQREVLVMRYYRNMSFKEIAEATSVSINTALGRMRYAILNMRRIAAEKDLALVGT
ncbi:MAG: sigma-70 family RNA polymerase sigma factor [Duncaniella sp.]|nr:sigma-70 family RNA polymerase sigma factor [Muribaculum sp.]MCM1255320.1 sigma-70 family RNA polymerase sigma factor [Duncaniella sp.]